MPHTPTLSDSRVRSTVDLHAGTLSRESLLHESDERLVALTRAGSERAFAEITRRYQRQLRAYCSRLVGVERAQDAVQQALFQAFLNLRDHAPREISLRPWLYRIAHNCSIDLLRMGSWEYEQLDLEFDGVAQPPALLEQKEELRGLVAGMRRLPEAQRRALTLRELEGCSYQEISERLGHTGSGVRQLIFRARSTLRKGASAVLLPFALVRDRLAGMAPAVEGHQVAGMAAVPASSGGGMDTIGAAALAVVAVLGGMAGGARGSHHQRQADRTPQAQVAGQASAPAGSPLAAPPVALDGSPEPRREAATRGGMPAASPRPDQIAAPAPPPLVVAPTVAAPEPPAPPTDTILQGTVPPSDPVTPVDEGASSVEQQTVQGGTPAPPPPAPEAGSTSPAGPAKPRPPVISPPAKPAKPRPPAAPGKPKKNAPATARPAEPR